MNLKEIKELIDFLIEKDVAEFDLERGDVKVRIKRGQSVALYRAVPHCFAFSTRKFGACTGRTRRAGPGGRKRASRSCRGRASPGEVADCRHLLRVAFARLTAVRDSQAIM